MEQIVPNIGIEDIRRIVKRDFPQSEFTEIKSILSQYYSESSKGGYRVFASILKLSGGNIELLKEYAQKLMRITEMLLLWLNTQITQTMLLMISYP